MAVFVELDDDAAEPPLDVPKRWLGAGEPHKMAPVRVSIETKNPSISSDASCADDMQADPESEPSVEPDGPVDTDDPNRSIMTEALGCYPYAYHHLHYIALPPSLNSHSRLSLAARHLLLLLVHIMEREKEIMRGTNPRAVSSCLSRPISISTPLTTCRAPAGESAVACSSTERCWSSRPCTAATTTSLSTRTRPCGTVHVQETGSTWKIPHVLATMARRVNAQGTWCRNAAGAGP